MKKILLFIVWIIWIFWFCSADEFILNSVNFPSQSTSSYSSSSRRDWFPLNLSFNSDATIYTICFWLNAWAAQDYYYFFKNSFFIYSFDNITYNKLNSNWYLLYNFDNSNSYYSWSFFKKWACFDFSWLQLLAWQKMYYWIYWTTDINDNNYVNWFSSSNTTYSDYPLAYYNTTNWWNLNSPYWVYNSNYDIFTYNDVLNLSVYVSSSYRWYYAPIYINYDVKSNPKFKINYWNTSYEYTLEDNLEIHLDSPVVKNWNVYSYVWSTWINLFYNWTSQFYNKDKLYLFTPSRYSNNIFTPICL